MEIKPIRNQQDYEAALRRVESLWDSKDGSPELDELDVLATLVEAYEREHYPMHGKSRPDSPIGNRHFPLDDR